MLAEREARADALRRAKLAESELYVSAPSGMARHEEISADDVREMREVEAAVVL